MIFQRILVPVDYSANSLLALGVAGELAERLGSTLDIVHVWDRPTYMSDTLMVGHGPEQRPLKQLIEENAQGEMREFLKDVRLPAGVATRERLLSGDPSSALLKEVERESFDLIVVGTHGRSGLAHLLLGSVAEKLVRHAKIPVLTVPRLKG